MVSLVKGKTIDGLITEYVSGLSGKSKLAVLIVVKTIAEAEEEAEFEKKWAEPVPLEKAFKEIHDYIKTLEWKK